MKVTELSREQLFELKCNYLCNVCQDVDYYMLANIDDYVTEKDVFEAYADINFVEDDFWS